MSHYTTTQPQHNGHPHPVDDDEEIFVTLAEERLHVPAGRYLGRSVQVRRDKSYGRVHLTGEFELYHDEDVMRPIGRVPFWFRDARPITPGSTLGAWLALADLRRVPGRRLSLTPLRGRLWQVQVRDVLKTHDGRLHARPYSRVACVLGLPA